MAIASFTFSPLQQILIACAGGMGMATLILALVVRHRKPRWIQAGHYAQLMELASDSVLVMDLDGRILDANLQAVAQYGYPLEVLRGMQVLELRDPETQLEGVAQFARVKDGSSLFFESQHRRCDGTLFPVEVSSRRIQVGNAAAILSFIRDITARKQVEAALRASEEKFSMAFRANPDSININRLSDGAYLTVNEGFTRITGYTAEDVLGRSSLPGDLGIWVEAADRGRLQEGLRREGRVEGLETSFRRKDGTLITGLMSAALIEVARSPDPNMVIQAWTFGACVLATGAFALTNASSLDSALVNGLPSVGGA